ncbi:MAG: MFS transporter [Chloroflexi bacterium]|nr:MFS transporter [Chloroflexota bacterium]
MLRHINHNNRLFMLGNFLFALSYGLWMNLRQLHLGDLGATPVEVGTMLGIVALAGGLLPIPAGLITDRVGPKRVLIGAWIVAALGTLIAALATNWPMAGIGFAVFMLVIAANPATVTFVLLNTANIEAEGQAERVMATVFASWPAAMIFAPALGGLIAQQWGIGTDLWLGVLGLVAAVLIVARATDVRPAPTDTRVDARTLLRNRRFVALAIFYPLALVTLEIGYVLAPTYLEAVRGYAVGTIGALFSVLSAGSLLFNYIVGKARPRVSFVVLIGAVWLGTFLIWQSSHSAGTGIAFALLGAISTMWLLAQTSVGQLVSPQQRGLALGVTETLGWLAIALASWLAGQLYEANAAHDLPLIAGVVAMLPVLALWLFSPLAPPAFQTETNAAPAVTTASSQPAAD